ncbi:MAG: hypothetical protein IPL26_19690 [Leptospiraceae bacterium]|nr:hypothetical protein [Leptospiraceae bacterium]
MNTAPISVNAKHIKFSQCNDCKHRQAYKADVKTTRCDAFGDIPNEILRNQHDHTKPYPGDNGILFEESNS